MFSPHPTSELHSTRPLPRPPRLPLPYSSSSAFPLALTFCCTVLDNSLSPSLLCRSWVTVCVFVCAFRAVMLCQTPAFMLCCSFPLSSHLLLLLCVLFLLTDPSTAALPSLSDSAAPRSVFMRLLPTPSLFLYRPTIIQKPFKVMLLDRCSQGNASVYLDINVDAERMRRPLITLRLVGDGFLPSGLITYPI